MSLLLQGANYNVSGGRLSSKLAGTVPGFEDSPGGGTVKSGSPGSVGGGAGIDSSGKTLAAFSLDDVSSTEELLQMRDTLKLRLNKSYVKMSKVADL